MMGWLKYKGGWEKNEWWIVNGWISICKKKDVKKRGTGWKHGRNGTIGDKYKGKRVRKKWMMKSVKGRIWRWK